MDTRHWRLTAAARRELGDDAAEYIDHYAYGTAQIADTSDTPADIAAVLTRRYGPPTTIDRGEVAYWYIDADDLTEDSALTGGY